jgi:hypothetical protein
MHIKLQFSLQIVSKLLLFVNFRGSNSAEGGTYQLADMYRRGPNPLADMDQGGLCTPSQCQLLSNIHKLFEEHAITVAKSQSYIEDH